jgi:hypothetical protein
MVLGSAFVNSGKEWDLSIRIIKAAWRINKYSSYAVPQIGSSYA